MAFIVFSWRDTFSTSAYDQQITDGDEKKGEGRVKRKRKRREEDMGMGAQYAVVVVLAVAESPGKCHLICQGRPGFGLTWQTCAVQLAGAVSSPSWKWRLF
jgi:hypothetical protein